MDTGDCINIGANCDAHAWTLRLVSDSFCFLLAKAGSNFALSGTPDDVEVIPIQKINEAYERLVRSDVKYRFSIDMASLKSE